MEESKSSINATNGGTGAAVNQVVVGPVVPKWAVWAWIVAEAIFVLAALGFIFWPHGLK